ncbi:MAG: hypothetical protein ACXVNF_01315 [Neobacillus sp.]
MIKIIKEIVDSSKNVIIERIKSPLLSSFGLFWLVINWKIPLILIGSGKNLEDKIAYIDSLTNRAEGFLYPLIGAVFYAGIYPLINYGLFMLHQEFEKKAEIIKAENLCEVLNKKIEVTKLESTLERTKYNEERRLAQERQMQGKMNDDYNLEIKRLEAQKQQKN